MSSETSGGGDSHIKLVGELVAAYISNNHVAPSELPGLIASVHAAISVLAPCESVSADISEPETDKPTSAKIRKSITSDALISFIDGKGYSTLKRHLTANGFDPASYRAQYGLPVDYPMVARAYSERRAALARNIGLGLRAGQNAPAEPPKPAPKGRKKRNQR